MLFFIALYCLKEAISHLYKDVHLRTNDNLIYTNYLVYIALVLNTVRCPLKH